MLNRKRLVNFLFEATSSHDLIWYYDPFYLRTEERVYQFNERLARFRKKFAKANLYGKASLIGKVIRAIDLPDTDAYFVNLKIDYEIRCQTAGGSKVSATMVDYEYFIGVLHVSNNKIKFIDSYGSLITDSERHPELISIYFMAEEFALTASESPDQYFYLKADDTYTKDRD